MAEKTGVCLIKEDNITAKKELESVSADVTVVANSGDYKALVNQRDAKLAELAKIEEECEGIENKANADKVRQLNLDKAKMSAEKDALNTKVKALKIQLAEIEKEIVNLSEGNNMVLFSCHSCKNEFEIDKVKLEKEIKCPHCNSTDVAKLLILGDRIEFHEKVTGKSNKLKGKKKPASEFQHGQEKSVALDKWVNKERVIDRVNDRYFESVIDPDTGEVIHECEEALSKHFEHGSAKKKEGKNGKEQ